MEPCTSVTTTLLTRPAAKSLTTYPHYMHLPSGIVEAEEATLATVLHEIEGLIPRSF